METFCGQSWKSHTPGQRAPTAKPFPAGLRAIERFPRRARAERFLRGGAQKGFDGKKVPPSSLRQKNGPVETFARFCRAGRHALSPWHRISFNRPKRSHFHMTSWPVLKLCAADDVAPWPLTLYFLQTTTGLDYFIVIRLSLMSPHAFFSKARHLLSVVSTK